MVGPPPSEWMSGTSHFPTNLASPRGHSHHDTIDTSTRTNATISQRRRRCFGGDEATCAPSTAESPLTQEPVTPRSIAMPDRLVPSRHIRNPLLVVEPDLHRHGFDGTQASPSGMCYQQFAQLVSIEVASLLEASPIARHHRSRICFCR